MSPRLSSHAWIVLGALLPALPAPAPAAAQNARDAACTLCHGEPELLRRHTPSLDSARALLVTGAMVRASAHDTISCGGCHSGYGAFPHDAPRELTRDCVSCHEQADEVWHESVHARPPAPGSATARAAGRASAATCIDCHGVHDVVAIDLDEPSAVDRIADACVSCHALAALPATDPHADSVSCSGCHSGHDIHDIADPASSVAPLHQPVTCGGCHAEAADSATHDAHGRALAALGPDVGLPRLLSRADAPPTCSSCHDAHGMRAPSHPHFEQEMVEACGSCHQDYADTYFGTYHGKATALGSEIVATCYACHGAHSIFPADSALSMVADARLVETCAECHAHADASFVLYDSHPNPLDRERNPPLFFSFVFMNVLLVGVLSVFTLHTALWWLRLWLDSRKGGPHHGGGDAGTGDGGHG